MYRKTFNKGQFTFPYAQIDEIMCIRLHMLSAEDDIIQPAFRREPAIWEHQQWDREIWVKVPPRPGQGWEKVRQTDLPRAPILEYGVVVREALQA